LRSRVKHLTKQNQLDTKGLRTKGLFIPAHAQTCCRGCVILPSFFSRCSRVHRATQPQEKQLDEAHWQCGSRPTEGLGYGWLPAEQLGQIAIVSSKDFSDSMVFSRLGFFTAGSWPVPDFWPSAFAQPPLATTTKPAALHVGKRSGKFFCENSPIPSDPGRSESGEANDALAKRMVVSRTSCIVANAAEKCKTHTDT